jgi:hypothetical protein
VKHLATVMLILLVATSLPVFGQTRGNLSGVVNDPSGAAVANAKVNAKNVGTGDEFKTTTDALGSFVFPSLPIGRYTVAVEAQGFKKADLQDIVVQVEIPAKVLVGLEVGAVTEEVTVVGESQAVINTVSPTLTNVVNIRQVRDLPLPARNPLDLARLQAGIAVSGTDTRNANVGGLRGTGTTVTQDGINAMDNFVKTSSFFAISAPSLESIEEFSVTTGTVGSDAGRGVAQVRMVTKGGTNDLHGSVFYQARRDAWNANTFFNNSVGTPRPLQKQHFFGFTVGGPTYVPKVYDGRNRSFWFFSYEGFRENFSATRNRTVLTPEARRGDFRYTGANGQLQSVNLLTLGNFKSLNSLTTAQLNAMPAFNNTLVGDGLNTAGARFNVTGRNPNDKIVMRADQKLFDAWGSSHKLEFVLNRAHFLLTPDTFNGLEAPFPGGVNAFQESTRWLTTAAIHSTFGSKATNEVRFGHQRAPVGFLREDGRPSNPFRINLGVVTDFENGFMSQGRNTLVYQFVDNFSFIKRGHTFRMGSDIQSVSAVTFNDAGIQKVINIGVNASNPDGIVASAFPNLPAGSTGNAIVSRAQGVYRDLVGLLGSGQQSFNVASPSSGFVSGASNVRAYLYRDLSFYFQDTWRMRQNFTFNIGVRYEWMGVPEVTNGLALQPVNGPAGLFGISGLGNLFRPGVFKGSEPQPLDFVSGTTGKSLYNNDNNNFAPFIGIAYSPKFSGGPMRWLFGSEGKSSIRAGYSISYLRDGFTVVTNAVGNPGLNLGTANTTPTGVLTQAGVDVPIPTFKVPRTDADNFALNTGNGLATFDPNLRAPYVQQWSFGIEREIANNTALEVRYVANHAVKVFRGVNYNEVNIFENGFLQEFLNAQKNLQINGGRSFGPGAAGTVPLPILSTLFAGLSAGSGFSNSTFISNLQNNNVATMASTLAFSTTYAGNRANLPRNFFVANPNAAGATVLTNGSYSNYNSLQVELRRRFSKGLQLQANYTFSKSLADSDGGGQSTNESYRTLRNLRLDYHRTGFDQTHRFIANGIYDLPFGPGRRFLNSGPGIVRKAIEGWNVGTIVNWQSGGPIFVSSGRSTFNTFNTGLNPALLVGTTFEDFAKNFGIFRTGSGVFFIDPKMLNLTINSAGVLTGATLKPGLLDTPPPGQFGNFPRNSISGPRFFQTDISLIKTTTITEKARIQLKANFINVFNATNFTFGSPSFDSATFGRISGDRGPRQINFILRVEF